VSSAVITLTPEMEAETSAWTIWPSRPVMVASMMRFCPGRAEPNILTPRSAVSLSRGGAQVMRWSDQFLRRNSSFAFRCRLTRSGSRC
jgi:hypothetical protein